MTIVRAITSHSENAAALEAGLFSSALASDASSSAFLLEMLQAGVPMDQVSGLVDSADSFVSRASTVIHGIERVGKQSFRNLIPIRVAVQVVGDSDRLSSTTNRLSTVLTDFRTDGETSENLTDLITQLDDLATVFLAQASDYTKPIRRNR